MHQRQCENVCDLAVEFAKLMAAGAVLPMQNEAEPMMTRFAVAITVAVLLGCWPVYAQVGGMGIFPGPALGMTSPLRVGPGSPVAPTRIPMGATELTSSGVSPLTSGASPLGLAIGGIATCSGAGGSLPQASPGMGTSMPGTSGMSTAGTVGSTTIFDGGGTSGSASGTCAGIAGAPSAGSATPSTGMGSTLLVSRLGIPLGSTEIGVGGLSPPSAALTPTPLAALMTFTPLVVTPIDGAPFDVGEHGSMPDDRNRHSLDRRRAFHVWVAPCDRNSSDRRDGNVDLLLNGTVVDFRRDDRSRRILGLASQRGLKFVSQSWFNLDATWASTLVLVGVLSLVISLAASPALETTAWLSI